MTSFKYVLAIRKWITLKKKASKSSFRLASSQTTRHPALYDCIPPGQHQMIGNMQRYWEHGYFGGLDESLVTL